MLFAGADGLGQGEYAALTPGFFLLINEGRSVVDRVMVESDQEGKYVPILVQLGYPVCLHPS